MSGNTPSNKEYFERLMIFAKKVFSVLRENNIDFVIYGSFALFYYTKDSSISINDIDIMVHPQDSDNIVSFIQEKGIECVIEDEDIYVRDGDLLIEIDGWGLGNEHLESSIEKNIVQAYGVALPLVTLETLESIYAIARDYEHNTDADKILDRIRHLESHLGRKLKN